jgi:hypothetical protein
MKCLVAAVAAPGGGGGAGRNGNIYVVSNILRKTNSQCITSCHLPGGANSFSTRGNGTVKKKSNYNMLILAKIIQLIKQDFKLIWQGHIITGINAIMNTSFFPTRENTPRKLQTAMQ